MSALVRSLRRSGATTRLGVTVALLAVVAAGCTGDSEPAEEPDGSPVPGASTGAAATLDAKPVPLDLKIVKVHGKRLTKERRRYVRKRIGNSVSAYFDDAYLGGRYPRSDFSDAFQAFFPRAARLARPNRRTLTNAALGPETDAVVPRRKIVRLSVLQPGKSVAGVTARVRLVFEAVRAEGVDRRVTVTGRLLLSRAPSGQWKVFGFDMARSDVPVGKGADR
jgi:hypothetical protein